MLENSEYLFINNIKKRLSKCVLYNAMFAFIILMVVSCIPGHFMPYAPLALLLCYFSELWRIDRDMQKNVETGELVLKYSVFAAILYLLSLL